ncbi:MAG: hypothetical protein Q4C33_03630 [bacterium]|nr:hypothetical protein [bacterium]
MNNYCRNCGIKLENNIKECPNCKTEVFETRITESPKTETTPEQIAKEKKYILAIIILYALSVATQSIGTIYKPLNFLTLLSSPFSLSSKIILIYARITTKNKAIKILFIIFIVTLILKLLAIILLIAACSTMVSNCNG